MVGLFPNPVEGTNKYPLSDGWVLKMTYRIERKIDEAALALNLARLTENNISADKLVVKKPELSKRAYNGLTVEEKLIFDECLIIKPGSASLEIVLPASAAAAMQDADVGNDN